jgi:hypothetical protein
MIVIQSQHGGLTAFKLQDDSCIFVESLPGCARPTKNVFREAVAAFEDNMTGSIRGAATNTFITDQPTDG